MITSNTPQAWYEVITLIGGCVRDALAGSLGGLPDRVCLTVPGQIAWDDCTCGQLALSVGDTFLSDTFPNPSSGQPSNGCGPAYWAAPITVSVLRCAPSIDGTAAAPTCAVLATASQVLESDRQIVLAALACCLKGWYDDRTIAGYVIGAQSTVGPEGGCVGVNFALTIGINNCSCGS